MGPLRGLKEFIDYETRSDVVVQNIVINDIPGVMHGDYSPPRTWIDWWFRKGDLTIALCLQSKAFPFTQPNDAEIKEHTAIIDSITSIVLEPCR
jgi:hypothetical protein